MDKYFDDPGRETAVIAEAAYLVNLLLLPGLGFLFLSILYFKNRGVASALAKNHLSQTFGVSIIGGALVVVVVATVVGMGAVDNGYTWMWVLLYFTCIHSGLIFMGVVGFVKALNNQHYSYPVLGKYFQQ